MKGKEVYKEKFTLLKIRTVPILVENLLENVYSECEITFIQHNENLQNFLTVRQRR
jgi:hypothetical protein